MTYSGSFSRINYKFVIHSVPDVIIDFVIGGSYIMALITEEESACWRICGGDNWPLFSYDPRFVHYRHLELEAGGVKYPDQYLQCVISILKRCT